MLRMFYNSFQVFLQVFQMYVSSVSSVFRRILQLHLDVSKVDHMLHTGCAWKVASAWAREKQARAGVVGTGVNSKCAREMNRHGP
jgi:hypothetical protein